MTQPTSPAAPAAENSPARTARKDYLPHTLLSRRIDHLADWIGRTCSYIWLLLLGVIVANVVMRYAFSQGRIEMEELPVSYTHLTLPTKA